jgi:hypothetical protein
LQLDTRSGDNLKKGWMYQVSFRKQGPQRNLSKTQELAAQFFELNEILRIVFVKENLWT